MKKVLIVHDISCYGKCSTTVALPILSAMELTGTILPTSLLSTHTGPGFENFTFLDLTDEMPKIVDHWKSIDLRFEAIYIGYLGSERQINFLIEEIPQLLKEDGKVYLDTVMADDGKFYHGFDESYAKAMVNLVKIADVVMPNRTEAAFMFDLDYRAGKLDQDAVDEIVDSIARISDASVVLTGAGLDEEAALTGTYYFDKQTGDSGIHQAPYIEGSYHGTGDIFGSILVGGLMNGSSLDQATKFATDSIPNIIEASMDNPNMIQDGLDFEKYSGELNAFARKLKT